MTRWDDYRKERSTYQTVEGFAWALFKERETLLAHRCDVGLEDPDAFMEHLADISKCPMCGGPADNGHDRCLPPNPYVCSKEKPRV